MKSFSAPSSPSAKVDSTKISESTKTSDQPQPASQSTPTSPIHRSSHPHFAPHPRLDYISRPYSGPISNENSLFSSSSFSDFLSSLHRLADSDKIENSELKEKIKEIEGKLHSERENQKKLSIQSENSTFPASDVRFLPDVVLDVPELSVGLIQLDVENLRAHLDVHAKVAKDLVQLDAGVNVSIDRVHLEIRDVRAQAHLRVKLDNVRECIVETLHLIGEHPEILHILLRDVKSIVDGVGETLLPAVDRHLLKPVAHDVLPGVRENVVEPIGHTILPSVRENVVEPIGQTVLPAVDRHALRPITNEINQIGAGIGAGIGQLQSQPQLQSHSQSEPSFQSPVASVLAAAEYSQGSFTGIFTDYLLTDASLTETLSATTKLATIKVTGKLINFLGIKL